MGIYDREYYRDDEPRRGLPGSSWSIVTKLIVANIGLFVLDVLLAGGSGSSRHWLFEGMSVTPESLAQPLFWWRFVTYGFAHDTQSMWHIVGNMLTLGMFGRHVEPLYGRKEFLRFYLVTLVLCALVWAVKERVFFPMQHARLLGASGAVTAVFMLFVFHYPHEKLLFNFFIPMPAWLMGIIMILGNLFTVQLPGQSGTARIAFDVHLVGIAFAAAYFWFGWRIAKIWPSLDGASSWGQRFRLWRNRPQLRVHSEEPPVPDEQLELDADRILAKLNAQGDQSLTPKERRILEKYSDQLRRKRQDRNRP